MGFLSDLFPPFPPGKVLRVFGVVKVRLNGTDYRTKPGAEIDVGGRRYTSQFGNGKRSGVSWEPVPSVLSAEFLVSSQLDWEAIRDFKDGIAEYVTDVGIVLAADNCTVVEPPAFAGEGKGISITIEGDPAYKVAGPTSASSIISLGF